MSAPNELESEAEANGRDLARLALVATLCGILSGVFGAVLSLSLLQAAAARQHVLAFAHQWPLFGWLIPVAFSAGLVTIAAWLVQRFAPVAAGSGVQHVEAVMRGEAEPAPIAV